jgi:hypothetical protein
MSEAKILDFDVAILDLPTLLNMCWGTFWLIYDDLVQLKIINFGQNYLTG